MAQQACGCCPDWDEDYGALDTSCDPCTKSGNNACMTMICRDNQQRMKADCVAGDPLSGKITDVVVESGKKGINIFANDKTVGWTSSETANDNNGFDVSETLTFVGSLGQAELNWVRKYKGKCVTVSWEDNCGTVWSADLKLNDYTAEIQADENGLRGITINFTNTTEDPFCEVHTLAPVSGNYSSNDEYFDYITTLAA